MCFVFIWEQTDLCRWQHKLIGFYNRDEKCLERGIYWVFQYSGLRLGFKGFYQKDGKEERVTEVSLKRSAFTHLLRNRNVSTSNLGSGTDYSDKSTVKIVLCRWMPRRGLTSNHGSFLSHTYTHMLLYWSYYLTFFIPLQIGPRNPSTLLYNVYRVFLGGKAAGAWCWQPTPSSAKVKEKVEI
jgi:hypothetical protein